MSEFDDYDDDYETDGWDSELDDVELLPCPNCQAEIDEDSVRCPVCGEYITFSTNVWQGRSWWWILLGLLGVVATMLALL